MFREGLPGLREDRREKAPPPAGLEPATPSLEGPPSEAHKDRPILAEHLARTGCVEAVMPDRRRFALLSDSGRIPDPCPSAGPIGDNRSRPCVLRPQPELPREQGGEVGAECVCQGTANARESIRHLKVRGGERIPVTACLSMRLFDDKRSEVCDTAYCRGFYAIRRADSEGDS
jgi:hypothetical protein